MDGLRALEQGQAGIPQQAVNDGAPPQNFADFVVNTVFISAFCSAARVAANHGVHLLHQSAALAASHPTFSTAYLGMSVVMFATAAAGYGGAVMVLLN